MNREDMLMGQLETILNKKNTMSRSEFSKYEGLFQRPSDMPILNTSDAGYNAEQVATFVDERQHLSLEWNNRVNIQKPVKIVDDVTKEELIVIPPALSEVKSLNEIDGIDAENVINALNNSHDRSTRERNLVPEQVAKMKVILQHARTKEEETDIVDGFANMANSIVGKKEQVVKPVDTVDAMSDAEWE